MRADGIDPLRDGGTADAEQLARDGVPTHHENYEAMVHGLMALRDVDSTHDAIATVADDLAEALGVGEDRRERGV